ncbi:MULTISPECIES: hypothetical protein [Sorangium]|uniref:Uncharacterized protein n=1 Tax=Sorangium cellulosum (strain So ce56) TaxID=448385 RepID=A9FF11_SORC5|nr:hypothetical protein [Sorangium cellulosum]CAN94944.1 hypothetical protein predicted by Glimmer/Critica [Sorangium cellulosum So ce56]
MTMVPPSRTPARKRRKLGYRGSGTFAMCSAGPHPGGPLFRQLCTLADRFNACEGDPAAAQIGSVLSLLALYATKPNDRDFRLPFGSFVMDLALADEARARAPGGGPVPYGRPLLAR